MRDNLRARSQIWHNVYQWGVHILFRLQWLKGKNKDKYMMINQHSRTKFRNLNVSRLVLQLLLSNSLKPNVKSRMRMIKKIIAH